MAKFGKDWKPHKDPFFKYHWLVTHDDLWDGKELTKDRLISIARKMQRSGIFSKKTNLSKMPNYIRNAIVKIQKDREYGTHIDDSTE